MSHWRLLAAGCLPAIGTLCKVGIAAFCNASHAAAKLPHARQLSFAHFAAALLRYRVPAGSHADAALKCDLELLAHPVNFSAESFSQRAVDFCICKVLKLLASNYCFCGVLGFI